MKLDMPWIRLSLPNHEHWNWKGIRDCMVQPCHLRDKEKDAQGQ